MYTTRDVILTIHRDITNSLSRINRGSRGDNDKFHRLKGKTHTAIKDSVILTVHQLPAARNE